MLKVLLPLALLLCTPALSGERPSGPIIWTGGGAATLLQPQLCFPDGTCVTSSGSPVYQQMKLVTTTGTDSATCGTINAPCLTGIQALTNITDATSSKKYAVIFGVGTFADPGMKDFVYLFGQGPNLTTLTGNITYNPGNGGSIAGGMYNLACSNITVTRLSSGASKTSTVSGLVFNNVSGGTLTYNGLGIFATTGIDGATATNSSFGNVTLHSSSVVFERCNTGTILTDDTAIMTTDTSTVISKATGTLTTQTGKNYATGAGAFRVYDNTTTPRGIKDLANYTAYDASTGIFSGVTYQFGGSTVGASDYISNASGGSGIANQSRTGRITVTSTGSAFSTLNSIGNVPHPVTLNGAQASIAINGTMNAVPTLNSGALATSIAAIGNVMPGNLVMAGTNVAFANKTAAYTALPTDDDFTLDATSAPFAITLPTCNTASKGRKYGFKRINAGTNLPEIDAFTAQTIEGFPAWTLDNNGDSVSIRCNGSGAWFIF